MKRLDKVEWLLILSALALMFVLGAWVAEAITR